MSIIRVGLTETKGYSEGYSAIFGTKKAAPKKPAAAAKKAAPAAKKPAAAAKKPAAKKAAPAKKK